MRLATGDSNESVCAGTMVINVDGSTKFTRQGNDLMQKIRLGPLAVDASHELCPDPL